jgi:hypothetical protein
MPGSYKAQAADAALLLAERIAAAPDTVAVLETAGADVAALVAVSELAVGLALRESTYRTERLDSTRRTEQGTVPVRYTFGRGTEADEYPLLDGAPVGCPETLRSYGRERAAAADEQRWARQCARAEQGLTVSRRSLRNAKRAARRARATIHTEE